MRMNIFVFSLFLCTSVFAMKTEYLPLKEFSSVFQNKDTNDTISINVKFKDNVRITSVQIISKEQRKSTVFNVKEENLQVLDSIYITGSWLIHGTQRDNYKYKLFLDTPNRNVKGVVLILKNGECNAYLEKEKKDLNYKPRKNDCRLIELKASFFVNVGLGYVFVRKKGGGNENNLEIRAFDRVLNTSLKEEVNSYMCYFSMFVVKKNEKFCLKLTNAKMFFDTNGHYKIVDDVL